MAYLLVPLVALGEVAAAVEALQAQPAQAQPAQAQPAQAQPAHPRTAVVDLTAAERPVVDPLAAWVAIASASPDACLVVDRLGRCAGVSVGAATLLGHAPADLVGRDLGVDLLDLLDFSDGAGAGSGAAFVPQIPPLLSLTSNVLTRGLLRLRRPDGGRLTLDAVAAPLHDGTSPVPVGAISFLLAV